MPASENHSTLLGRHPLNSQLCVLCDCIGIQELFWKFHILYMVYSKGDKGDCTIGAVDLHICTIGGFDLHHIFTDQDY